MGKILCVTRGGEASFRTQQQAIQRAKEPCFSSIW